MVAASMRVSVEQVPNAGLPPRVSYSQMSLFQQCGLKYFFAYVDGWKEPPNASLAGGTITHDVIERLYRLDPSERTLNVAMDLLREFGARMLEKPEYKTFATDNKMKLAVKEAVENLFQIESPHELVVQPEHIEMELDVEINGVKFFGKVDRFTIDGINRVTDYKTGKAPGRFIDGKLAQPYLYALGFKTQYDIDVDEVELIFLNAKEVVRREVSSGLMNEQGEKLAEMRIDSERSIANGEWDARPSALCGWCAFERVCPAKSPDAPMPGNAQADVLLIESGLKQRLY